MATAAPVPAALKGSFLVRATHPTTAPLAATLYRLMHIKGSNLCLSADVTTTSQLLSLVEELGDDIAVLKTHADIIDDFGTRTIEGLIDIGRRKKFIIFEDRKFGDIGSTVQKQYVSGPLRIAQWAAIVNAHIFPGPTIIKALRAAVTDLVNPVRQSVTTEIFAESVSSTSRVRNDGPDTEGANRGGGMIVSTTTIETKAEPIAREAEDNEAPKIDRQAIVSISGSSPKGLLLLAEMSSEGNLLTADYAHQCLRLARDHRDFVIGFIAQRCLNIEPDDQFITFTPGVSLPPADCTTGEPKGDGLGQRYTSPRQAVLERGSDVVIVGRGILRAPDPRSEAERYRLEAWRAYKDRLARYRD